MTTIQRALELMEHPQFYSDSCQIRDYAIHHNIKHPKNETRDVFLQAYSYARLERNPDYKRSAERSARRYR